ncbi:hypothetical protein GCM10028807_21170 [Spirosoma daeguense]
MKLSEEQYEIIEAYLTNELSATDMASFESDMQENPELRDEVDRQRSIRLGLRAIGIERALERAKAQYNVAATPSHQNQSQPIQTVVRPLSTWRYWVAAASVVLLVGIGYFTYQQVSDRQTDVAYAENFTPDSSDQLIKEFPSEQLTPDTRKQFLDALTNYKAGKYDEVIAQLRTSPTDKQTVHYRNYFLGLSYLANKQASNAIPLLAQAQAAPSAEIRQKADWFLALAYVKTNQKEKAVPMLKRISADPANPFQSVAQRVLQKID